MFVHVKNLQGLELAFGLQLFLQACQLKIVHITQIEWL
jgi:hypothetical protein